MRASDTNNDIPFAYDCYEVGKTYGVSMINLTVLAPDIVGKILDNALPDHLILFDIAVDPPALWEGQWNLITVIQSLQVHKSKNPGANAGFFSFR